MGGAGFVKFPATPTIGLGAKFGYLAWTGKLTDLVAGRGGGGAGRLGEFALAPLSPPPSLNSPYHNLMAGPDTVSDFDPYFSRFNPGHI